MTLFLLHYNIIDSRTTSFTSLFFLVWSQYSEKWSSCRLIQAAPVDPGRWSVWKIAQSEAVRSRRFWLGADVSMLTWKPSSSSQLLFISRPEASWRFLPKWFPNRRELRTRTACRSHRFVSNIWTRFLYFHHVKIDFYLL